jgi:hypothetical protein
MRNLAAARFPEATRADLHRARERRHDLGKLLAFMLGDGHQDWLPPASVNSATATPRPPAASPHRHQSRRAGRGPRILRNQGPRVCAASTLTLRCQQSGTRWEQIWLQPHNQTQSADLASQAS